MQFDFTKYLDAIDQKSSSNVLDGDTVIDPKTGKPVRLQGIDAPETTKVIYDQNGDLQKVQIDEPGAQAAKQATEILLEGGSINTSGDTDAYGRQVGDYNDARGLSVATTLAEAGLGTTHLAFPDKKSEQAKLTNLARGLDPAGESWRDYRIEEQRQQAAKDRETAVQPHADQLRDYHPNTNGTVTRAALRGLDMVGSMTGGFVEAMGEAIGADAIAEYGKNVRELNEAEMSVNAARMPSAFDIENASDAGTWAVEKIIENAPNAGIAAGAGVAAAGVAAILGGPVTLLGAAGAVLASYVLNTGEIQGKLKREDPDADTGATALAFGVPAAMLDAAPMIRAGKIVATGVKAADGFVGTAKAVGKGIAGGMAAEMPTEALQELTGDIAAKAEYGDKFDLVNEKNIKGWIDAGLAGGISGAAMGGGATSLGVAKEKIFGSPIVDPNAAPTGPAAQGQATNPIIIDPATPTVSEPVAQLDAQLANILDANTKADTMAVQQGHADQQVIADLAAEAGAEVIPVGGNGVEPTLIITTNPEKAAKARAAGSQIDQALMDQLLFDTPVEQSGKPIAEDSVIVRGQNEAGIPTKERLTSPDQVEDTKQRISELTGDPAPTVQDPQTVILQRNESVDLKVGPSTKTSSATDEEKAALQLLLGQRKPNAQADPNAQVQADPNAQVQADPAPSVAPGAVAEVPTDPNAQVQADLGAEQIKRALNFIDETRPEKSSQPLGPDAIADPWALEHAFDHLTRSKSTSNFNGIADLEVRARAEKALQERFPAETIQESIAKAREHLNTPLRVGVTDKGTAPSDTQETLNEIFDPVRPAKNPLTVNGQKFKRVLTAFLAAHFGADNNPILAEAFGKTSTVRDALQAIDQMTAHPKSVADIGNINRALQTLLATKLQHEAGDAPNAPATVADALIAAQRGTAWDVATLGNLYAQALAPVSGSQQLGEALAGRRIEFRGFSSTNAQTKAALRKLSIDNSGLGSNVIGRALELVLSQLATGTAAPASDITTAGISEDGATHSGATNLQDAFVPPNRVALRSVEHLVRSLLTGLGIEMPIIETTSANLTLDEQEAVVTGRLPSQYDPDRKVLFLSPSTINALNAWTKTGERGLQALQNLHHELGHVVFEQTLDWFAANHPEQLADLDAAWKASGEETPFKEWVAEQVGVWLTRNQGKTSSTQRLVAKLPPKAGAVIARIASKIKSLYNQMREALGASLGVDPSIDAFMSAVQSRVRAAEIKTDAPAETQARTLAEPTAAAVPMESRVDGRAEAQDALRSIDYLERSDAKEKAESNEEIFEVVNDDGTVEKLTSSQYRKRFTRDRTRPKSSGPVTPRTLSPEEIARRDQLEAENELYLAARKKVLEARTPEERAAFEAERARDAALRKENEELEARRRASAVTAAKAAAQEKAKEAGAVQARLQAEENNRIAELRLGLADVPTEDLVVALKTAQKQLSEMDGDTIARVHKAKRLQVEALEREWKSRKSDVTGNPVSEQDQEVTFEEVKAFANDLPGPTLGGLLDVPTELLTEKLASTQEQLAEMSEATPAAKRKSKRIMVAFLEHLLQARENGATGNPFLEEAPVSELPEQLIGLVNGNEEDAKAFLSVQRRIAEAVNDAELAGDTAAAERAIATKLKLSVRGAKFLTSKNYYNTLAKLAEYFQLFNESGTGTEIAQAISGWLEEVRTRVNSWSSDERDFEETIESIRADLRAASKGLRALENSKMPRDAEAKKAVRKQTTEAREYVNDLKNALRATRDRLYEGRLKLARKLAVPLYELRHSQQFNNTGIAPSREQSADMRADEELPAAERDDFVFEGDEAQRNETGVDHVLSQDELIALADASPSLFSAESVLSDVEAGIITAEEGNKLLHEMAGIELAELEESDYSEVVTEGLSDQNVDTLLERFHARLESLFGPHDSVRWYKSRRGRENGTHGKQPTLRPDEGMERQEALETVAFLRHEYPEAAFVVRESKQLPGRYLIAEKVSGVTIGAAIRSALVAGRGEPNQAKVFVLEVFSRFKNAYVPRFVSATALMRAIYAEVKNPDEFYSDNPLQRFVDAWQIAVGSGLLTAQTTDSQGNSVSRYRLKDLEMLASDGKPLIVGELHGTSVALGERQGALNALTADKAMSEAALNQLEAIRKTREMLDEEKALRDAAIAAHPATSAQKLVGLFEFLVSRIRALPEAQRMMAKIDAIQKLQAFERKHHVKLAEVIKSHPGSSSVTTVKKTRMASDPKHALDELLDQIDELEAIEKVDDRAINDAVRRGEDPDVVVRRVDPRASQFLRKHRAEMLEALKAATDSHAARLVKLFYAEREANDYLEVLAIRDKFGIPYEKTSLFSGYAGVQSAAEALDIALRRVDRLPKEAQAEYSGLQADLSGLAGQLRVLSAAADRNPTDEQKKALRLLAYRINLLINRVRDIERVYGSGKDRPLSSYNIGSHTRGVDGKAIWSLTGLKYDIGLQAWRTGRAESTEISKESLIEALRKLGLLAPGGELTANGESLMKQVAAMAEEDQLSPFNLERLLHAEEMRIMASMKERGVESTIGLDTVEVEALQGATFGVGDVGTTTEQKDEEYANRLIQAEVLSGGTENVAQETAQVQLHSSGTIITRMAELAKAALEHIGLPAQIRLVDEAGIAAVLAKVDTELAALQQTLMRVAASPETAEKTARISSLISRRGALEAFREQLISQAQSKEPGWIMFSNSEWVDLRTPVVFLSDKITGSLEKARVLAHELGHLVTHEVLDQFPDIKAAIAKELQASASPLETEENLAKQFERYLVKAATTLPDSAVGRFFSALQAKLRALWDFLTKEQGLSGTYEAFINAIAGLVPVRELARTQSDDQTYLKNLEDAVEAVRGNLSPYSAFRTGEVASSFGFGNAELDSTVGAAAGGVGRFLARMNQAALDSQRFGHLVSVFEHNVKRTADVLGSGLSLAFSTYGSRVHALAERGSKSAAYLRDGFSRRFGVKHEEGHRTLAETQASIMGLFAEDFAALQKLIARGNPETIADKAAWWRGPKGAKQVWAIFEKGQVEPVAEFESRIDAWKERGRLYQADKKQRELRKIAAAEYRQQVKLALNQTPLSELKNRNVDGANDVSIAAIELLQKAYDLVAKPVDQGGLDMKLDHFRDRLPLVIDTAELLRNRKSFVKLLEDNAGLNTEEAESLVRGLLESDGVVLGLDSRIYRDGANYSATMALLDSAAQDPNVMAALTPFLNQDIAGLVYHHLHALFKRGAADQLFGGISNGRFSPTRGLFDRIDADNELSDDEKQFLKFKVYPAILGRLGMDSFSPFMRRLYSVLMTYQNFRLLGLATLSSMVDVGVLASRGGLMNGYKAAVNMMKDSDRPRVMAAIRRLGIISDDISDTVMSDALNSQYLIPGLAKMNESFFRFIGLTQWTRMTRTWATGAGIEVLRELNDLAANGTAAQKAVADRQFKDLQLDQRTLSDWLANPNATTAELLEQVAFGDKFSAVGAALNQFVDEAVLRPTSGDRPGWAQLPMAGLIWQLKSFLWLFHERVLKRVWYEMSKTERRGLARATPAILLAAFILPIAGSAYGLRRLLSGDWDKLEKMDADDLAFELFQRGGLPGLFQIWLDADQAADHKKLALLSALGPTVGQIESFFTDESSTFIGRSIPGIASSGYLRRTLFGKERVIYEEVEE